MSAENRGDVWLTDTQRTTFSRSGGFGLFTGEAEGMWRLAMWLSRLIK
jgi:hypothetical protein